MPRKQLSSNEYVDGVLSVDKVILAKTITLVESTHQKDEQLSEAIMEGLMPATGNSIRVGITGVPGVGKSTFIETFGTFLTKMMGKKVAVLAVDPTSKKSKGSILGDKTRMEKLALDENAFIRPSPTRTALGGVAAKTREVMLVCEAAGYDIVLVETVGVGQSETAVKEMTDFFLLLMLAGAGDELQGIKKGIIEMADLIAINKADGENTTRANVAQKQLSMALHALPSQDHEIPTSVLTCSGLDGTGIDTIWNEINKRIDDSKRNGIFESTRKDQNLDWMHEFIRNELLRNFNTIIDDTELKNIESKVSNGTMSPKQGCRILIDKFGRS